MMFKKRYLLILLFLIICAITISQASAADLNETDAIAGDVVDDEIMTNVASEEISNDINSNEIVNDVQSDDASASSGNEGAVGANYGTFKDLNDLIAANYGKTITLDCDYYYDPSIDEAGDLDAGIDIQQSIVINGNGHTIYSNGARAFWIYATASIVSISNLKIENTYTWDSVLQIYNGTSGCFNKGGAIMNLADILMLEGCTFSFNCARNGGAIYSPAGTILYVDQCNFINNTAAGGEDDGYGGAICSYGSAIVRADSGKYSIFINNTADYGGAIATFKELYVYNSGFGSNFAFKNGGAIWNSLGNVSHVTGSVFSDNYAKQYAGAVWNSIVLNSEFDKNNGAGTSPYGYNMALGVQINCNAADQNSYNFVQVVESTGFLFNPESVEFIQGTKGKTFEVVVTSNPTGDTIRGVKVRLSIDGQDNYTAVSDGNGVATFTLPQLTNGKHKFIVNLPYSDFNDTNMTYSVQVGKYRASVDKINPISYYYGSSGSTVATITGGTIGSASVVNHPEVTPTINGNKISVSGLAPGKYTLTVVVNPDSTHESTMATVGITVLKKKASITAKAFTTYYKSGKKWTIALKDTTNNRVLVNARITIRVYTGSSYRNFYATTNANGVASFAASTLTPGNHKVVLSYSNGAYICSAVTRYVKVNKMTLAYVVTAKDYNDGSRIDIQVRDKVTYKPINGVKLKLVIYTGSRVSKTVYLVSGNYGGKYACVAYATALKASGYHTFKVMSADNKYYGTITSKVYIRPAATSYSNHYLMVTNGRQIVR